MKKWPKVFIVILNYNGKEFLTNCLKSIFKVNYPDFSVVVVDNNSQDGSFESAKLKFGRAFFIRNEENLGFSVASNIGIRFSLERGADYVLLLNNDTEVESDFLTKLIEVGEKNPQIGLLSPLIYTENKARIWFSGASINWFRMKVISRKEKITQSLIYSQLISRCAMLVKKDVFKKLGLFDEDFFNYWEDADFCYRSSQEGFRSVIVPQSIIYHLSQDQNKFEKKAYWKLVSSFIFFRKNCPGYLKPWIYVYNRWRRVKNDRNIKHHKTELSLAVQKAYLDYDNFKRRKN